MGISIYGCKYVWENVCTGECMYGWVYAWVFVWVGECVYVCMGAICVVVNLCIEDLANLKTKK